MKKEVFCRHCGKKNNVSTYKCECGKVINPLRAFRFTPILVIALAASVLGNIYLYGVSGQNYNFAVGEQLEMISLEQELSRSTANYKSMERQKNQYAMLLSNEKNQSSLYQSGLSWYKKHIGLVTNAGSKYHTYDCQYLDGAVWGYNIELAKSKGYTPCEVCHDDVS